MAYDPYTDENGDIEIHHPENNDYVRKIREVMILSKTGPRDLLAVEDYLDELEVSS